MRKPTKNKKMRWVLLAIIIILVSPKYIPDTGEAEIC